VLETATDSLLADLRADGRTKQLAVEQLHALLLRAARFEVARRRPSLPHLTRGALYKTLHDARQKLREHLEEEADGAS
jgi:hypothetical protein